jgi:hypothetical protein
MAKILLHFTFIFFYILISFINNSSSQFIINQVGDESGPTIITRQIFTVHSGNENGGTNTRIIIYSGKNLNSGNGKLTPFDIIQLMDNRINNFFEEMLIRRREFFNVLNSQMNNDNNQDNDKDNENNKDNDNKDNNNSIDDKEFELEEENGESQKKNDKEEENKDKKNIKNEEFKYDGKEKNNKNKKKIGKLSAIADSLKSKKKIKKLTKKEIIFSRICKYIFYSIILFTFYILIKKLLEILEIIDPERSEKNIKIDVDINNKNKNEEKNEKIEGNIILNKERENKQN